MSASSPNLQDLLKTLTVEQLAELGGRIESAQKAASDPTRIPAKVSLHIDINDSTELDPSKLHADLLKAAGTQTLPISEGDISELQMMQSALLKWISASTENAALFAAFPVRALRKSGVPINKDLLARLEGLSQGFAGFASFAGIPVDSVVLQAKPTNPKPTKDKKEKNHGR